MMGKIQGGEVKSGTGRYVTLLFGEGFSSQTVKTYLEQQETGARPISLSGQKQIWSVGDEVDVEKLVDGLPTEWPLTNAFESDSQGEDAL